MKRWTVLRLGIMALLPAAVAAAAQTPSRPAAEPADLIRMFDRDGDGRISREEAPDRMRQRWDQIDTDRDGHVTLHTVAYRFDADGLSIVISGDLSYSESLVNLAREGGAVYNYDRGAPEFISCRFVENSADYAGAMVDRGGAVDNFDNGVLGPDACTFSDNLAAAGGGAMSNESRSRAVIVDCRFAGNRSERGQADVATDDTSSVSRNRSDWPDQTVRPRPTGFGPPRSCRSKFQF